MKPSGIFRLASMSLSLYRDNSQRDEIRRALSANDFDCDSFIRLCSNHLVLPAIYRSLKKAELLSAFEPELRDHLQDLYILNKQRNLEIIEQAKELNRAFISNGIKPVFLKGVANLLDGLYADPGERMIGDIDLLVEEKDFNRALGLAKNLNYYFGTKVYDDVNSHHHYPILIRKNSTAGIEIHSSPINFKNSGQFSTELVMRNKEKAQDHAAAYVPSIKHRLIHTFIHSQLSDNRHKLYMPGLRDMYDACLLSNRIDWRETLDQIEEREKAQIFFEYMDYLYGTGHISVELMNKNSRRYIRRHQWLLDHPGWRRIFYRNHNLFVLLFIRYPRRIFRAFLSEKDRHSLFNRLKDPQWYGNHWQGLKEKIFR